LALATLAAYITVQLAIGAYVSRRIRTETDYIVAGRSLGLWLGTFTIFATWFGAETCIGAAGAVYEEGMAGARADPFGYGLCLLLMGALLARPLYRRKLTTLADLYRQRYGPGIERLAVLLMVPASVLWAAAQVRAFGGIVAAAGGFSPEVGVTAAALVVVLYTVLGGALADAYHDLIQGVVLVAGLVVLAVVVFASGGGEALAQVPAARFNPFAGVGLLEGIEKWAVPICGSVVAVELVSRVIACRSEGVAQRASFQAAGLYGLIGLIPVALGLIGAVQAPGLSDPEGILPALAGRYLPGALTVVFTGALVAAILSTVDSTLLVSGALVSHNVVVPMRPGLSERGKLVAARLSVVAFAVVAYVLALGAEGVYALVIEASAFGSAGLFVAVLMALFTRVGGAWAAGGALLSGLAAYLLADKVMGLPYPYLTSLAAAALAFAAGAVVDRHGPPAPAPQVTGL
jgi:Na+/proline symporter